MNYGWVREQWDRVLAVVAIVIGMIALLLGWLGVSGHTLTPEQIPYLASGAIVGLFALGVGATLWLSADMRDEFGKLDEIYQYMQDRDQPQGAESVNGDHEEAAAYPEPGPVYASAAPRRRPLRARPSVSTPEP
jgi:hypothetical protein